MKDNIVVPKEVEDICRALSAKANGLGLDHLSGKFKVGFDPTSKLDSTWTGEISFSWKQGRHGEESNTFSITLQAYHNAKISV